MHYLPSSEKLQEQQHFLCPDRLLLHIHTVVAFLSMLLLAGGSTSDLQADYVLVGSYLDFLAVDLCIIAVHHAFLGSISAMCRSHWFD
jgi:hypothetical protein